MKGTATMPRARTDGLVIRELDDETLVYDTERDEAHCLNQTAGLVWQRCDGKTTVGKTAAMLQKQFSVPIDVDVVWLAIRQLKDFHLIEDSDDVTVAAPSVSRRTLLLKYAPAALALPVIMSISVPAPAQAGSCAQQNQSCLTLPCCPGQSLICSGSPPVCVLG